MRKKDVEEEDPFAEARGELDIRKGDFPAFKATTPGMSVTTIDVPSVQNRDAWHAFLNTLCLADGMVILRPDDKAEYDEDGYLYKSEFLSEVHEITDSRPMFIVCVCKGPLRGAMVLFAAISTLVLATKDATFGFPDHRKDSLNTSLHPALKKRLTEQTLRRLLLVGDTLDAVEAQRFGLVDFIGDEETVENEVCRLIYRNCSAVTACYMYKPDMLRALEAREAEETLEQ